MPSHRSRENASFRPFNIRAQAGTRVGLFPAGQQQITVQLPALMLEVEASSLMISQGSCSTEVMSSVGEAVSAGATAVILREGSGGAAELLEAAFSLKELLRGRAALLLVDRTDIATAAEADGVLLTDQGLPTVVAKRMMQMRGESVLVGRIVTSVEAAVAAAADGASLVLISDPHGLPATEEILRAACSSQRSGNAIPVISYTSSHLATREQLEATWPATAASSRNGAGSGSSMDGLAVPLSLLQVAAISAYPGSKNDAALSGSVTKSVDSVLRRLSGRPSKQEEEEEAAARAQRVPCDLMASSSVQVAEGTMGSSSSGSTIAGNAIRRLMSVNREALITEEKAALNRILKYLEEVVPQMDELQLLRDSLKQLDDLFLVVVVGEFNSGKSSVINALLGKKYLAEGILPTTNEISILRYSNEHGEEGQFVQQSDGQFVRYLPAPLLKEMNIVDTPGTNVILDRQQRLTEEYVPRADLVLFVMSADRPFSESEVKFLEYIRQWRKKVVFVVNKVDMLGSVDEVAEVKRFVFENAQRLLKLDSPNVLTVSSRAAMRAKADVLKEHGLPVNSWEDTLLLERPEWIRSGYSSLEAFIFNFLAAGESDKAGEGVRLKLQTPLFVADALLGASARSLKDELDAAKSELRAVSLVEKQLVKFQADMERDAAAQREALNKVLMDATSRLEAFVDRTIQLSNASAMNAYLSGSKTALDSVVSSFEAELSAGPLSTLQGAVSEHQRWLELNCSSQLEYYKRFVAGRGGGVQGSSSTSQRSSVPVPSIASSSSSSSRGGSSGAVATAKEFSSSVVVTMLSEEMREAVVGTAGLTVGGPVGGLLVSTLTGGTFEDLLILTIGGLVAYVSVINIPLRRAAIKAKGRTIAANFVKDLQAKMEQEQEEKVILVMSAVRNMVAPIQAACSKEVDRLEQQELRRQNLLMELTELQKKAANVE